jgi:hypothetical protein
MSLTLGKPGAATERSAEEKVTYADLRGLGVCDAERRIEPFVNWLRRLSSRQRLAAAGGFGRCELWIWARYFSEEVPLVNGEFPWIAVNPA